MSDGVDLTKSATVLYYQQRAQSARPYTVRVPAGPGVKLVSGELRHSYGERPEGTLKMGHTPDFADVKKAMMKKEAGEAGLSASAGANDFGATGGRLRPSSAGPSFGGTATGMSTGGRTRKVVYWDGKSHHVVDAAEENPHFKWVPPHLKQPDIEPGIQLGVRETPGACRVKLVGSKFRYLPTMEPTGTCMWAVSPHEAAKYGTLGYTNWGGEGAGGKPRPLTATASTSPYATARSVGYKEYEAATKMLNGVGSWERTQRHLMSSMEVGRPSRLVSPGMKTGMGVTFSGLAAAAH